MKNIGENGGIVNKEMGIWSGTMGQKKYQKLGKNNQLDKFIGPKMGQIIGWENEILKLH